MDTSVYLDFEFLDFAKHKQNNNKQLQSAQYSTIGAEAGVPGKSSEVIKNCQEGDRA